MAHVDSLTVYSLIVSSLIVSSKLHPNHGERVRDIVKEIRSCMSPYCPSARTAKVPAAFHSHFLVARTMDWPSWLLVSVTKARNAGRVLGKG